MPDVFMCSCLSGINARPTNCLPPVFARNIALLRQKRFHNSAQAAWKVPQTVSAQAFCPSIFSGFSSVRGWLPKSHSAGTFATPKKYARAFGNSYPDCLPAWRQIRAPPAPCPPTAPKSENPFCRIPAISRCILMFRYAKILWQYPDICRFPG